jgi:hypothetical protein
MSDESFMHAAGESHDCVVPAKAPNQDPQGSAEGPEGRRSIKENTVEANPSRMQSREIGSRGLTGAREAAKKDKGLRAPLSFGAVLRQSSAIRTVCANERPHGSVRGVPGNRHPYRDPCLQLLSASAALQALCHLQ